jgi:Cu(I)/Ag(I) efflux system membrane fusion protein
MRKAPYALLLLIVIVLSFLASRHYTHGNTGESAGARRILYYVDPMHPAYKSDRPGIAPDCGMQLEPVYADGADDPASLPAGSVHISLEQQQLIGVRVAEVARHGSQT